MVGLPASPSKGGGEGSSLRWKRFWLAHPSSSAVGGEMVVGEQGPHVPRPQRFAGEGLDHAVREQAVAVLDQCRGIPDWLIGRQTDEPAVKEIAVALVHEQGFRSGLYKGSG